MGGRVLYQLTCNKIFYDAIKSIRPFVFFTFLQVKRKNNFKARNRKCNLVFFNPSELFQLYLTFTSFVKSYIEKSIHRLQNEDEKVCFNENKQFFIQIRLQFASLFLLWQSSVTCKMQFVISNCTHLNRFKRFWRGISTYMRSAIVNVCKSDVSTK